MLTMEQTTTFVIGQAVHTAFWGDYIGRVCGITVTVYLTFYEVELRSGRIVVEPETHISIAPEYEYILRPVASERLALNERQIARGTWDVQDYGNYQRYALKFGNELRGGE